MCRHLTAAILLATASALVLAADSRPNIVLLIADDLHYQSLGCMGEPVKTPNIDRLAARGALFRNCVAQGTCCSPSRNALLTGSYPHNTGVYHNQDGNMPQGAWTCAAALRRAGYATAIVGKDHLKPHSAYTGSPRRKPYEQTRQELEGLGFEYVHATGGKDASLGQPAEPGVDPYVDYVRQKGLLDKIVANGRKVQTGPHQGRISPSPLSEDDCQDGYIARKAAEWIVTQPSDRPFFLWVGFTQPHPPADAPEPYASMYDWRQMRVPLADSLDKAPQRVRNQANAMGRGATAEMYQKFRAAYYGMMTFLDAQVERVMQALQQRGALENTVVVFCADQGSILGDHGLWGKSVFYKGAANAPLVIAGPGLGGGLRIDRLVELIDLAPTFLALAQASAEDHTRCRGESLLPLLTGRGTYARTVAFCEDRWMKMVVTSQGKYVEYESQPVLFELAADPDELHNLAGQRPELQEQLKQRLSQWLEVTAPVRPANPVLRGKKPKEKSGE